MSTRRKKLQCAIRKVITTVLKNCDLNNTLVSASSNSYKMTSGQNGKFKHFMICLSVLFYLV